MSILAKDATHLLKTIALKYIDVVPFTEREKYIIYALWATDASCDGVGKELDLTRERIRQIHNEAIEKIESFLYSAYNEYKQIDALRKDNEYLLSVIRKDVTLLCSPKPQHLKEELELIKKFQSIPIDTDILSVRAVNACKALNVKTVIELTDIKERQLLELRNCGVTVVREIKYYLRENGLSLK